MEELVVREDLVGDDSSRAFIQAFIARQTFTFEEARPVLAGIFSLRGHEEVLPQDVTESDFNTCVTAANYALSPYDMEIRSTLHQRTHTKVFALVNVTSDSISQLATFLTADEVGWLKRVLDTMFETNNSRHHEVMSIKGMDAMRLNRPSRNQRESLNPTDSQAGKEVGITMVQAERLLDTLVEQGFFEKSKRNYYSLAPRALMELRGWLVETYNVRDTDSEDTDGEGAADSGKLIRIKMCYACKGIVTMGQRCSKLTCNCRVHDICVETLFRTQPSRRCPVCKEVWTGEKLVGERADIGQPKATKSRVSTTSSAASPALVRGTGRRAEIADGEAEVQNKSQSFDDLYDVED